MILYAEPYLKQIRYKKYRLDELMYEKYLEQNGLIIKAQDLTKPVVSGGQCSDLSMIPVHIEEYIREIEKEEQELYAMKSEAKRFISIIPDDLRQTVLRYYYIDCIELYQIADKMGYSKSYVYSLKSSGIVYLNSRIRAAHLASLANCIEKVWIKKFHN